MTEDAAVAKINVRVPSVARIYDHLLGGKDNYLSDREAARRILEIVPDAALAARQNRAFLRRAIRFLAAEAGMRQFLDVGAGLPTVCNTHEVAQSAALESRVVYVDNDPMVLAHARALLTSTKEGACAYHEADLRDVKQILAMAEAWLDFSQPVAVVLLGVMQFISDRDRPAALIGTLMSACSPGSFLVLGQPAIDVDPERMGQAVARTGRLLTAPATMRTHEEILGFFDGLELLEPGLVQLPDWRPEPDDPPVPGPVPFWCGVARKR